MNFEVVLPLLKPIMTDKQYIEISEETTKKERIEILVNVLKTSPESMSDRFCNAIAGLYPELFCAFMEREPTADEKGTISNKMHYKGNLLFYKVWISA